MTGQLRARYVLLLVIVFVIALLLVSGCGGGGTPTPTSTPTPTVTPGPSPEPTGEPLTPAGVPDSRLGLAWISSFYQGELKQNNAQYAASAGATWDRWPFERSQIPRIAGLFVFDHDGINYTGAISQDEAHGLNTLAVINGPVPNPSAPDLDDWREYVEAIVTAYSSEVDAWEIGNEGGLPQQGGLSAEGYVDILRTTCEVLYEHGQGDKPILLGSPELGISLYSSEHWDNVLRLIRRDRTDRNYGHLPDCLDAVGVHIYGRPIFSYDAIVRNHSRAGWNPGVWITEHGVMWQDEPLDKNPFANKYRQASYVVQQYVLALTGFEAAGINPLDFDRAKIFYHRFADANSEDLDRDRYWGLMDYDRDPRYPSYDAMSLVTSLFSGASAPDDLNPDSHEQESVRHYRFEKGGQYIHVLWAANEAVPGWSFLANGTDPGHCATMYYQPGDGIGTGDEPSEYGNDGRFWKASLPLDPSGEFTLDLPASAEENIGNDEYSDFSLPMIGGPVYILVETNEPCEGSRAPTGGGSLIWSAHNCIARPDRTYVWGYDEDSGLDHVTVECSPATEYDLRWTTPGRIYAGVVRSVPPEGATCTLTLYDRAGNFKQQTLHNPGPKRIPGCDHPDDTYSAASVDLSSVEFLALPGGARAAPRVAILDSGFAGNMLMLLFDLGEPAVLIESDFDPVATVAQYPVLLIPSGGLYGLENSASFRARLEEYARLGGVIVAFAQQHGYEYSALPGGEVTGYGWSEDLACFDASLYLSDYHPLLSGLDRATLNVHVDGYFTAVPTGTQVLLSRRANGMPAAVLYPFPPGGGTEGGWVFATTIYDDWGAGHGQSSSDARTLLRDLLTWAITPAGLPAYVPAEPITLDIPITNTTPYTATAVALRLVDPARHIAFTVIILRPADATRLSATGYPLTANGSSDGMPVCPLVIVHWSLVIVHCPPCPTYTTA